MSRARVAVLQVVSKQLSVTEAAAEYGFSRRHLHRLLVATARVAWKLWLRVLAVRGPAHRQRPASFVTGLSSCAGS